MYWQKTKETFAKTIFLICGLLAIVAVLVITAYMTAKGIPAISQVGFADLIFGTVWKPTAENPSYGIFYIILSSIVATFGAVLIGVPIALLTAVFLTDYTSGNKNTRMISKILQSAVELLAAIPSVIYGLIGMMVLNPIMYDLEKKIYANSPDHQFTGGANLLSAIIVLAVMILPTVINVSVSSIKAVPDHMRAASLALGATKLQTIFKVVIPAAKSGIMTGGGSRHRPGPRRGHGYKHGGRRNG